MATALPKKESEEGPEMNCPGTPMSGSTTIGYTASLVSTWSASRPSSSPIADGSVRPAPSTTWSSL
jgi:hypothetical protein